ncbi:hypothetical protein BU104_12530 [Staphylococcus xylosus]|uniref:Uncharacterized protein n=1 Tax=Staphylococcus xylosus TaxID=1288 RepID=A0AAQ0LXV8_STAXY|nr:hypothetical protein [Staphylococcus xylosus]RIM90952.1 hypothetical protein BU104_12530 [Staphylococcus xylosus]
MYKELSIEKYIPKKYRNTVEDFYKDMDGCWLNLKEGYISADNEATSIHEDTIKDVKSKLKTIISEVEFENMTREEIMHFLNK